MSAAIFPKLLMNYKRTERIDAETWMTGLTLTSGLIPCRLHLHSI